MQIFIKIEKTLTLDCESSDSVKTIKQMILEKAGIPLEKQRLICNSIQLNDDNMTLEDCNINPHQTIHLLVRWC